jgi:cell wall assembly regulator SMI1
MKDILQLLDKHISSLRANFYSQLQPPLTEAEIENLENQYKVKLPADLKELYKWKNGQSENCTESFMNNSMFMPLEDSLFSADLCTSMIGYDFEIENWWNKSWIPIFHNGNSDHICFDIEGVFTGQPQQIIEFWHADNDRNVIAPNLSTLISNINSFYELTNSLDFDEYFTITLSEGFPKRFEVA